MKIRVKEYDFCFLLGEFEDSILLAPRQNDCTNIRETETNVFGWRKAE